MRTLLALAALAVAILMPGAAALEPQELLGSAPGTDPGHQETPVDPNEVLERINPDGSEEEDPAAPPEEGKRPDFADRVANAFADEMMLLGFAGLATVAAGIGGFAMVTRYISPKEALKNPQRSMLYGYVKGNPGVHLKALSEEFSMKTSSILWHIRKLESADLVKSERANGFRVFYAVEGGVEIKRISRAITALQNDNARRIFEAVQGRSGATTRQVAEALTLHGGTTRWHLRKLRDHGLVDELVQDSGSRFYATPLGGQALEAMAGRPVEPGPAPTRAPNAQPNPVEG